jgi:hypothetical protein
MDNVVRQRKSNMTTKWHQDTANVLPAADLHLSYRSARVSSSLETLCEPYSYNSHTHGNPPLIMLLTSLPPAIRLPQQCSGSVLNHLMDCGQLMAKQVGDGKKENDNSVIQQQGEYSHLSLQS